MAAKNRRCQQTLSSGAFSAIRCLLLVPAPCLPVIRQGGIAAAASANTTWRRSDSPYIVTADVTVRGTSTVAAVLTIEPGVEVRFMPGTGLTIGCGTYKGALAARGTEAARIVFTSNSDTPAPGDWEATSVSTMPPMTNPPCWKLVVDAAPLRRHYNYHSAPTIRRSVVQTGPLQQRPLVFFRPPSPP
ncbi:MAG: hypothetical protein U5J82_15880 [Desulfobacterales bacterium]|nr:hypothetical protein [Desulfobacterales bacterium]